MSKPVFGMLIGLLSGVGTGLACIYYFSIDDWLARFCVVASVALIMQLLGATIAAAEGKPHK